MAESKRCPGYPTLFCQYDSKDFEFNSTASKGQDYQLIKKFNGGTGDLYISPYLSKCGNTLFVCLLHWDEGVRSIEESYIFKKPPQSFPYSVPLQREMLDSVRKIPSAYDSKYI